MNHYWWRSNGESGQSGFIHALDESDAKKRIFKEEKEDDVYIVLMRRRAKSNRYSGELYSQ